VIDFSVSSDAACISTPVWRRFREQCGGRERERERERKRERRREREERGPEKKFKEETKRDAKSRLARQGTWLRDDAHHEGPKHLLLFLFVINTLLSVDNPPLPPILPQPSRQIFVAPPQLPDYLFSLLRCFLCSLARSGLGGEGFSGIRYVDSNQRKFYAQAPNPKPHTLNPKP